MMDYLLLMLVKEFMRSNVSNLRILVASLSGSLLMCLVIILPIPYASIKVVLFHVVVNTVMIMIGFQIRDSIEFIKYFIFLYIGGVILGGVFQYFQQYIKVSSLFFFMAISSYWIVYGIWKFICYIQQNQGKWYDVEIEINENKIHVKALLDTGNGLFDPYTGEAVHVIENKVLLPFSDKISLQGMRYISYHSVGGEGVMQVIKAERMHLHGAREISVEKPLLAICEDKISVNDRYHMILNPDIL